MTYAAKCLNCGSVAYWLLGRWSCPTPGCDTSIAPAAVAPPSAPPEPPCDYEKPLSNPRQHHGPGLNIVGDYRVCDECLRQMNGAPPETTAPTATPLIIVPFLLCDGGCGEYTSDLARIGEIHNCAGAGTLRLTHAQYRVHQPVASVASSATPTPEPTRAALERIKTVYGRQEVSLVDRAYLMYAIATRALTTEPR